VVQQFSNVGAPQVSTPTDQAVTESPNDSASQSYLPRLSASYDYSNLTVDSTGNYRTGYVIVSDAYGRPTEFVYNRNLLVQTVRSNGYTTYSTYFPDTATGTGQYPRSLQSSTNARGLVSTYTYDTNGNVITLSSTGDFTGSGSASTVTTTYSYDTQNLPVNISSTAGTSTQIQYSTTDPYLPILITQSLGGASTQEQINYGSVGTAPTIPFVNGLVVSKSVGTTADGMATTNYTYNAAGQLQSVTDPTGIT